MLQLLKTLAVYMGVQAVMSAADQAVRTVVAEKVRGHMKGKDSDKDEDKA